MSQQRKYLEQRGWIRTAVKKRGMIKEVKWQKNGVILPQWMAYGSQRNLDKFK